MQKKNTLLVTALALIVISAGSYLKAGGLEFDPYEKFNEAALSYSESRFDNALILYEDIISHGYESGALYYNAGNAYLKTDNLGKAILNYERALRIMPHDSDLKANLRYANSLKQQPAMEAAPLWLNRRIDSVLGFFTIDGLTRAAGVVYIFAILLLALAVFDDNRRRIIYRYVIFLAIALMIVITLLSFKIYQTEHIDSGIITEYIVDARFEPLREAPVHFKLYEGSKIIVLRTRGEWSQIKREDNKIGWIESLSYDII
jgi:tetratricopeptide (TPR) repeat protein